MASERKAICVSSGGLDSTVAATIANREHELHLIHISYGQIAAEKEKEAVINIAEYLRCEVFFTESRIFKELKCSSLIRGDIPTGYQLLGSKGTPSTWVPHRNLVLLGIGAVYASIINAKVIFTGFNAEEAELYPDNSRKFVAIFNELLAESGGDVKVIAPLIDMKKPEIIKRAIEVKAPIKLTWSCYYGGERHCGECEACLRRKRGIKEAGVTDPTEYLI